jgi:hypothetical protein
MIHDINMFQSRSAVVAWGCRLILLVYGTLMFSSYWSQLADPETTIRLVGSDVGCSLSAIDCSWLNFAIDKAVGTCTIAVAAAAEIARAWRYRLHARSGATIAALAHMAVGWVLFNPS